MRDRRLTGGHRPLTFVFALPLLAACGGAEPEREEPADEPLRRAVAVLEPTEGHEVRGQVTFLEVDRELEVVADVSGLTPGPHGFHIHETGDCSAPDASSAGGHFAPGGSPHGAPPDPEGQRHAGDLGNLEADSTGRGHQGWIDPILSLSGPSSVLGRAVVIHEGADDYTTQPSGDAGARVACGVIVRRSDAAADSAGP